MKRHICLLISLALVLCLLVGCQKSNLDNDQNQYRYKTVNNAVEIISYNNKESTNITVPETIDGNSVTTLGKDAFYQCKNAVSIILPQTLTTINGSPFYRCYSLQQIAIPKNVKSIDSNPFFRCSALSMISVAPENDNFSDVDGVLFNKEKSILIAYPEGKERQSYTVPSSVKKLNVDSFGYHTNLKQLKILSNVVDFPEENMFVFPEDIVLIIESGTAAEEYVKQHNLRFEYIK